ncbi:MAG: ABC transporter ATP-binding protein [Thermotogota bacterium]
MKIIEVKQLKKTFDDFTAVNGIDFSIEKGELFGFLGPNGAGKTTTINMLTGLAKPTEGFISIAGIDATRHIKKAQGKIGIVPDESNLYMEMNGFDNLCFCASLYGLKKTQREKKARKLLEQFKLDDTGKRPFKAYSKGMKRKLTIAAGIIHDPDILFLDEPTTGIDVESARQIRRLIDELHRSGTTIFLTTHYIEEAQRLCDRIAFIVKGAIIKTGSVQDLMKEAQEENVVEFSLNKISQNVYLKIADAFPQARIEPFANKKIRICTSKQIELMPIMQYFNDNGIKVFEAKLIEPSLEEVFVKVTGIEATKMKVEKEGGRG